MARTILALYKSSEGMTAQRNEVRLMLEFVLNDLGLIARHHDVSAGLPDDDATAGVLGVITWFSTAEMDGAADYCDWLVRQIEAGRKVVVFDSLGAFVERSTGETVDRWRIERVFAAIGVRLHSGGKWGSEHVAVASAENELMAFERPLGPEELTWYRRVQSLDRSNTVFLSVRLKDVEGSESDVIVATRTGGLVLGYAFYTDPETEERPWDLRFWHLNPWRFLTAALGVAPTPRMDLSVLNGRRLWFMHVDGDGFSTPSDIDPDANCAQAFERHILGNYRLPVTASVIAAEIDPAILGNAITTPLARRLFTNPLVEPASHTFSHPHDWLTGDVDLPVPGYCFDLARELLGSVEYLQQQLIPDGPAIRLLHSSGNCNMPVEGVTLLASHGVRVINVEDNARLDNVCPSVTWLTPATTPAGDVVRYSHRAANDFIMTERLTDHGGYPRILETFERTRHPRPLIPINVYVHWYSAQSSALLNGLRAVLDWSLAQPIAPVWAGTYLNVVDGFRRARLGQEADGAWVVECNGECRTVRFDGAERGVDLSRSEGVLGFRLLGDSLYVFLDGGERQRIVLTHKSSAVDRPRLVEASCFVHSLTSLANRGLRLELEGPVDGELVLAGLPSLQPYAVNVYEDARGAAENGGGCRVRRDQDVGGAGGESVVWSDGDGRLEVALVLEGRRVLQIEPVATGIAAVER